MSAAVRIMDRLHEQDARGVRWPAPRPSRRLTHQGR